RGFQGMGKPELLRDGRLGLQCAVRAGQIHPSRVHSDRHQRTDGELPSVPQQVVPDVLGDAILLDTLEIVPLLFRRYARTRKKTHEAMQRLRSEPELDV